MAESFPQATPAKGSRPWAAPTRPDAGDVTGRDTGSSNRQGTPPDPRKLPHEERQHHPLPAAAPRRSPGPAEGRSEEHTSELQSLMRISYAVFCLKKKRKKKTTQ